MSKWFSPETDPHLFKCPCGFVDCDAPAPTQYLLDMLDIIRDKYGKAITVDSGPRCKKHNSNVGGVQDSEHMTGEAADLACISSADRWTMLHSILNAGIDRIGIGKNFLHVGVGKIPHVVNVIWTYYP